jgi:hypothetical protein
LFEILSTPTAFAASQVFSSVSTWWKKIFSNPNTVLDLFR